MLLSSSSSSLAPAIGAFVFAFVAGCSDPVHDRTVASLGPEAPGVAPSALHRPGQPCVTCHDGHGARAFELAGTVFASEAPTKSAGIEVEVRDAENRTHTTRTNCAGNFFFTETVKFPAFVRIRRFDDENGWNVMESRISRERSCARCHGPQPNSVSLGPLVLESTRGDETCP